jgi:hypothetical protein
MQGFTRSSNREALPMSAHVLAKAGPVAVRVVGGSVAAASISTVLVAAGAAVALAFIGYGISRKLAGSADRKKPASELGELVVA